MVTRNFILAAAGLLLMTSAQSCIDNNNKDNGGSDQQESDYGQEAPTYNKTRDDMEQLSDTTSEGKRIPKDSVEIMSKGNASSK